MNRWPIERSWVVVTSKGERLVVSTRGLRRWPACGMLGAAGLGKTFELAYLAKLDRSDGLHVIADRLAVLGQTTDGLSARLDSLAAAATSSTALYLDALDEVMVPVRTAGLIVEKWVKDKLGAVLPRLRLSCRSAVWPPRVQSVIEEVYGSDNSAFAVLQPLTEEDVLRVAAARRVDANDFLRAVDAAGVRALSVQPLTLEMLLKIHDARGRLPNRRRDLFRQGMEQLASERRERAREGTGIGVPTAQVLEAAERLACFCLLSGRDVIDLSECPYSAALSAREVEGLPGSVRPLDDALLDAICRSGLCEGDGPDRFRFGHRQFAEYLAGRRIARLLPHQARSLLGAGAASQSGVAGPLRETAAFAAIESADIAGWVADDDPEVVGLSDVADASLRRRATLNLLDKFRLHELTDSQTGRDGIELAGFQYAGAEDDLRPVLRERHHGCEDMIECAVELIESWSLVSMSDDLASLVLDSTATLQNRKSAGYALAKFGTAAARRRLLPLIGGVAEDPDYDLKGLALRCNWPDHLTVPQLLDALGPGPRNNYHGAYHGFLYDLDSSGFDARGYRLQGLGWAHGIVRRSREYEWTTNLVRRIARSALDELDAPGIVDSLAELILEAAQAHADSPLQPPHRFSFERDTKEPLPPILNTKPTSARRALIDALAVRVTKDRELWWTVMETPGLFALEEFPWLMERALDTAKPMAQRENYAEFAWRLPWMDNATAVEAWLRARDTEPIASRFAFPSMVELDSEEAEKARKLHAEMRRRNRLQRKKRLSPPPAQRVEEVLALSETKDPRFFLNVCRELTLDEESTHYGFSRFLMTTPGWTTGSETTRDRIVKAAKRFLVAPSNEPERAKTEPLNSIFPGYMPAIWLVLAQDPDWIDGRPTEWWKTWAWYMLRELHPHMMGEPEEPKLELLRRLHSRAPDDMRESVVRLAKSVESETRGLLTSLLGVLEEIEDPALDDQLCGELEKAAIPDDRIADVAKFVLRRTSDRALSACLTRIDPSQVMHRESSAVRVAIALLEQRTREAWPSVYELMRSHAALATRVLGDFAHSPNIRSRHSDIDDHVGLAALSFGQIGQLVALLLDAFPPEANPRHEGVLWVGPDDSARSIRDQLISWLGDQKDIEAVEALRLLERQYGARYPWLRRPRSRAERSYRLSVWEPVPPSTVAEILAAHHKRLLRSNRDALDGVVAAIDKYSRRLRHESPSELDDLWNQPRDGVPTPKDEERVSDKVCVAIRSYFCEFAVAVNREVQVFRRKLAKALGGAAGSEVDVLWETPAVGTVPGEPIRVPVEVKLAHNHEAHTGLRDQLVERYMKEVGTGLGVYVVVWMGNGSAAARYRPLWKSPEEALADLEDQARALVAASPGPIDIRCFVIDASLPRAAKRGKVVKKAPTRASRSKKRKPMQSARKSRQGSGLTARAEQTATTPRARKQQPKKMTNKKAKKRTGKKWKR